MKTVLVQLAFTLIVGFQSFLASFCIVWPSYALKDLQGENSPLGFPLTSKESNLVGSMPMLGSLLANMAAGYICDKIGRKKSHILTSLFYVVAWSLIVTAKSTIVILIGRFLIGVSTGISIVVNFVYVGEITTLSVRGSSMVLITMLYNIGILVSYLEGWFCSYNVICYLSVTTSVIYSIVCCLIKESPVYLLQTGRDKEALVALKFYRGTSDTNDEILEELSTLTNLVTNENNSKALTVGTKSIDLEKSNDAEKEKLKAEENELDVKVESAESVNPWKLLWTVDYNRRALILTVVFMTLTVSMGMVAVQTYAGKFFEMAAPTMSADLLSVLLAVVFVVSSGVSVIITNLVPRRVLMTSTCAIATLCLTVIGSQLRWTWGPVWVAPVAITIYCIIFHFGCINVVFVQLSEIFGPQVNSTATAIAVCSMFIANFVVLSLYMPSVNYLGIDGTFFAFALIGLITTVLSILLIKETRYVPLKEVQSMYGGYLYRKSKTF